MLTLSELPTLTPTKAEAGVRAANKAAIVASAGAMVTSNQCSLVKRCSRQNRSRSPRAIVVFPVPFKEMLNMPPELLNLGGSAFFFFLFSSFLSGTSRESFASILRSTSRGNPATDCGFRYPRLPCARYRLLPLPTSCTLHPAITQNIPRTFLLQPPTNSK